MVFIISHSLYDAEFKILTQWQSPEVTLLQYNPNVKQEQFTIYLKNQRILMRLVGKLDKVHFSRLQDSILRCAIYIDEKMPKIQESKVIPFPNSGEDILVDLLNSLKLVKEK